MAEAAEPDRRLPNLVLAGVTKAGTTSLFAYLRQHDEIFVPVQKELNHFSPAIHGRPLPDLASYARHFRLADQERWRLDASPFYFLGGAAVAEQVQVTLDRPRVLVILRDPVERLWSSYTYKVSKGVVGTGESFAAFFERCVRHLRAATDLRPENSGVLTLRTGRYVEFLPGWMDTFGDDLRVVFAEDLARDPARVMAGIFGWLGVDEVVASNFDYDRRNVTRRSRSVRLRRLAVQGNVALKPILDRNPWLRRPLERGYLRLNTVGEQRRLTGEDRGRVQEFYAESVAALDRFLLTRGYAETPQWVREGRRRPTAGTLPP